MLGPFFLLPPHVYMCAWMCGGLLFGVRTSGCGANLIWVEDILEEVRGHEVGAVWRWREMGT